MTKAIGLPTCYICALPIEPGQSSNRDHVPMDRLFPVELRKDPARRIQLATVRVHEACNASYRLDEEYFVTNLALVGEGT